MSEQTKKLIYTFTVGYCHGLVTKIQAELSVSDRSLTTKVFGLRKSSVLADPKVMCLLKEKPCILSRDVFVQLLQTTAQVPALPDKVVSRMVLIGRLSGWLPKSITVPSNDNHSRGCLIRINSPAVAMSVVLDDDWSVKLRQGRREYPISGLDLSSFIREATLSPAKEVKHANKRLGARSPKSTGSLATPRARGV